MNRFAASVDAHATSPPGRRKSVVHHSEPQPSVVVPVGPPLFRSPFGTGAEMGRGSSYPLSRDALRLQPQ